MSFISNCKGRLCTHSEISDRNLGNGKIQMKLVRNWIPSLSMLNGSKQSVEFALCQQQQQNSLRHSKFPLLWKQRSTHERLSIGCRLHPNLCPDQSVNATPFKATCEAAQRPVKFNFSHKTHHWSLSYWSKGVLTEPSVHLSTFFQSTLRCQNDYLTLYIWCEFNDAEPLSRKRDRVPNATDLGWRVETKHTHTYTKENVCTCKSREAQQPAADLDAAATEVWRVRSVPSACLPDWLLCHMAYQSRAKVFPGFDGLRFFDSGMPVTAVKRIGFLSHPLTSLTLACL